MNTGTLIKAARNRAGMTLTELAEKTDSSASVLCDLENGKRKAAPTPAEMVIFSDTLQDQTLLYDYCDRCPVRSRILPRKFLPLNNVLVNAHASTLKTAQKLSEAADKLQAMLGKMLKKDFQQDPEYHSYRDEAIIRIIDAKRGAEILLDQLQSLGIVTAEELRVLVSAQQMMCVAKGHHIQD
jgi:transcriptional regulator with XRE-family HTH domain